VADDDVHVLTFTAWPQAVYTVQLHGALSATMVDAPGQTSSFTYFTYTSDDVTRQHIEAVRPAGVGCTKEEFNNYSPFATPADTTCIEGRPVQIDFAAVTGIGATTATMDWYRYGLVYALQPMLLGGLAAFNPVMMASLNATSRITLNVLPGKFQIHAFGAATAQVALNPKV
jgi:hypothetical protein